MRTRTKVLLCVALSFMVLFSSVGYAALNDTLYINGSVTTTYPYGIYIVETNVYSATNASAASGQELLYTSTVDSLVNLTTSGSSWRPTYGKVIYEFTVFNNTPYQYAYSGFDYVSNLDGYNGNASIGNGLSITVNDINGGAFTDDTIYPGSRVTFRATYTINNRNLANKELKTLVNYKFGINMNSIGDVALDAALVRFGEILNDTSAGGGYQTLTSRIDDKYDGKNDWKANYIGNVVDAHNSDTETINQLFAGKLSITIDGVSTNVTVLIKRENLDGDTSTGDDYTATYNGKSTSGTGCEMTLYMTTDPLQSGSPVVYAAVFTCDRNADGSYGKWYMIGDKYVGTANIVGYEGDYTTGSFDTGTWKSTGRTTFSACEHYQYTISAGQGISAIIQAKDTKAVTELQKLVNTAHDVLSGVYGNYAGTAIVNLQAAFDNACLYCTVDANGNATVNSSLSRAHAVPLMKQLEQALMPFANIIP